MVFLEVCIDCVAPIKSPQQLGLGLGLLKSGQAIRRLERGKLELGWVLGCLDGSRTVRRLKSDWSRGGVFYLGWRWLKLGRFEPYVDICEKLWLLDLRPLAAQLRLVPKEDPAWSEPNFCSGQKCPWFLFHIEAHLGLVLDWSLGWGEAEGGELRR